MVQSKHRLPLGLAFVLAVGGGLAGQSARARELVWELEPVVAPVPVETSTATNAAPTKAAPTKAASAKPAPTTKVAPTTAALVWTLDSEPVVELPGFSGPPVANGGPTSPQSSPTPTKPPATTQPAVLVGVPLQQPYAPPNLGGGVPTAYVANWGDYFISASGATPGKLRAGQLDGSVNMGVGFGDASRLIGIEVDWNIGSVRNFNSNGSFDIIVNRILLNQSRLQLVVAGGVQSIYSYTNGKESNPPVNGYGVVTVATPLKALNPYFNQVLQISAGVGGNTFSSMNANFEGPTTGYFVALGVEITSNVGLSVGVSGRGTNVNLSFVPSRNLPITINLLGVDLFNSNPYGTLGVLSVSWGDNFRTALF